MLAMRPNCECCDADLPADDVGAFICSFECTFCADCTDALEGRCPNCAGALTSRPPRAAEKLARFPAQIERVLREHACKTPVRPDAP